MTYQVLARKWRPRTFEQMVGQEHILRMLTNALTQQRIHHAYLFTGTRGVGKTTLGRLLAKCLNCETGITPTPCGTCQNCIAIDNGRFLDLLEVDAASRTRVEDTRELLENVHYPPAQGRFKIYLIDEVHMLSGHSFNALLKTIEEPPPPIKFLLATTDPKRLPITILSRCLQFNLKRVPLEQIAAHLQFICEQEAIGFEAPALTILAKAADGSLRDALSLLDQAIAYCGQTLTYQDTQQMLGSIEFETLYRLLGALLASNGQQLLTEIRQLQTYAVNFFQVLDEFLALLHQISIAQIVTDPTCDPTLSQFAKKFTPEEIQLYYQIALSGKKDLPFASSPEQGFEMILLRMLAFQPTKKTTAQSTPPIIAKEKIAPPAPLPVPCEMKPENTRAWGEILEKLALTGMAYALASNCTLTVLTEDKITLSLASQHEPMLNKKLTERIEQALNKYFNRSLKLDIVMTTTEGDTPLKKQQEKQAMREAQAKDAIENDQDIKKLMGLFDATLDVNSIKVV